MLGGVIAGFILAIGTILIYDVGFLGGLGLLLLLPVVGAFLVGMVE